MTALSQLELVILDCQTTGARPPKANLLELAWWVGSSSQLSDLSQAQASIRSVLIKQPKDKPLPKQISSITGIKSEDLAGAISRKKAREALIQDLDKCDGIYGLAHYAQFELPFLEHLFQVKTSQQLPFPMLCTHAIAKRLLPDIPSRSIRALAGFLGMPVQQFKRGKEHVEATMHIWKFLLEKLQAAGIDNTDALVAWLAQGAPKGPRHRKRVFPLENSVRLGLPDNPGVYYFKNQREQILYIGKATSLHARVNSYFRGKKKRNPRLMEMLAQAVKVDYHSTPTTLEAALLETDEIKTHTPPYNIALKPQADRLPVFANADFSSWETTPSEHMPIGPFSSDKNLIALRCLFNALQGQIECEGFLWGLDDLKMIKKGVSLFRKQWGLKPRQRLSSPLELVELGRASLPETSSFYAALEENTDEDVEIEDSNEAEDNTPVEWTWDPEKVASACFGICRRVAYEWRLGQELHHLAEARICWRKERTPWRILEISQAKIVAQAEAKRLMPKPKSATTERQGAMAHSFSHSDFDRLRILTTELRRLLKEKYSLRIEYTRMGHIFEIG